MIIDKTERPNPLKTLFPFSLLTDEEIKKVTPFFEQINFPEGATIFSYGYPANGLYFILTGSVKVTYHQKNIEKCLGIFQVGGRIGEEALTANKVYRTRAKCISPVTVLRIKGNTAVAIANAFPQIYNSFSLFQKTFSLACSEKIPWRHEDEGIELFSRRNPFFLFLRAFLVGGISLLVFSFVLFSALASKDYFTLLLIISLILLMMGSGFCVWAAAEWKNDYFILTHDRVLVQKKMIGFYEHRHESPINAILSVGIDTSVWGRLLGYGTVTVRTYTGDLRFERLPHPYQIYELLENRHQIAMLQASQTEQREIREALTGKTVSTRRQKTLHSHPSTKLYDEQTDTLSDLLARIFHLRAENEDTVTFRTHWWILLKKIFLPGLFMTVIVLLILFKLIGFFGDIPAVAIYMIGLILVLTGWGWWVYQYQDWKNDVYILTDDQLIDVYKKPLGNEDRRSAPIKNIQTVGSLSARGSSISC